MSFWEFGYWTTRTTLTATSLPGNRGEGGTQHRREQHPWVAPGSAAGGMGKPRHRAGRWAPRGGHLPVPPQLSEGNTGTEGGSQAQELTKHPLGWIRLRGPQPQGPLAAPPHVSIHLEAIFPFLKWLFTGRLAEGGTGFKCI